MAVFNLVHAASCNAWAYHCTSHRICRWTSKLRFNTTALSAQIITVDNSHLPSAALQPASISTTHTDTNTDTKYWYKHWCTNWYSVAGGSWGGGEKRRCCEPPPPTPLCLPESHAPAGPYPLIAPPLSRGLDESVYQFSCSSTDGQLAAFGGPVGPSTGRCPLTLFLRWTATKIYLQCLQLTKPCLLRCLAHVFAHFCVSILKKERERR